jgi:hypothetical protein
MRSATTTPPCRHWPGISASPGIPPRRNLWTTVAPPWLESPVRRSPEHARCGCSGLLLNNVHVARGSVSSSANRTACPRWRRHSASFPRWPARKSVVGTPYTYCSCGSAPLAMAIERVAIGAGTAVEHLTKACFASRSPVADAGEKHRAACARLHATGAWRRSATNRLRIQLPDTTEPEHSVPLFDLLWRSAAHRQGARRHRCAQH